MAWRAGFGLTPVEAGEGFDDGWAASANAVAAVSWGGSSRGLLPGRPDSSKSREESNGILAGCWRGPSGFAKVGVMGLLSCVGLDWLGKVSAINKEKQ